MRVLARFPACVSATALEQHVPFRACGSGHTGLLRNHGLGKNSLKLAVGIRPRAIKDMRMARWNNTGSEQDLACVHAANIPHACSSRCVRMLNRAVLRAVRRRCCMWAPIGGDIVRALCCRCFMCPFRYPVAVVPMCGEHSTLVLFAVPSLCFAVRISRLCLLLVVSVVFSGARFALVLFVVSSVVVFKGSSRAVLSR